MTKVRIGPSIEIARNLLEQGELVALPTETVYGLGGNALNAETVARIFEVKDRPHFDPIIVHVSSLESAMHYVTDVPAEAEQLANRFWPGPLTLLLPKRNAIPDLVTAGLDRVGLRCPDHPLTLELLKQLPFPVAAPSANPFGYVSPTNAQHVKDQLGDKIKFILDGGPCTVGIESTIVGWENSQAVIYRLGGLSVEEIESVVANVQVKPFSTSKPQAPGQLQSHYSPKKKFVLGNIQELAAKFPSKNPGVLVFQNQSKIASRLQFVLSPTGNLNEAARNLFAMLRELDKTDVDIVFAEEVPDVGIGRAINDRLRRASYCD